MWICFAQHNVAIRFGIEIRGSIWIRIWQCKSTIKNSSLYDQNNGYRVSLWSITITFNSELTSFLRSKTLLTMYWGGFQRGLWCIYQLYRFYGSLTNNSLAKNSLVRLCYCFIFSTISFETALPFIHFLVGQKMNKSELQRSLLITQRLTH